MSGDTCAICAVAVSDKGIGYFNFDFMSFSSETLHTMWDIE